MKKVILIVALVIVAFLGLFLYYALLYGDNMNFRTELAHHLAQATEAGTLTAEQDGVSVSVPSGDGLLRALSRGQSDRKRLFQQPQDFYAKITLHLGDMTLSLYALPTEKETVVLEKDLSGSKRWYSLSGYAMYHWLCRATGLEEKDAP
jgi:hypothetical protein